MSKRKKYQPILVMDTDGFTAEEFTKARQAISAYTGGISIGGSDVAAIYNVSPWTSSLELYDIKTGKRPAVEKALDDWQLEAGHALEEGVAKLTRLWLSIHEPYVDVRIVNDTGMYQHGETDDDGSLRYPFAVANLDRIIYMNGQKGILECKTTSYRNKRLIAELRAGIIPVYYELQIRFYMAVMNLNFALISFLWGNAPSDMAVLTCRRDFEKEELLMETVKEFVGHIKAGTAPDFGKCDPALVALYYTRLYGKADEEKPAVDVTKYRAYVSQSVALDEKLRQAKETLKALEAEREKIYNRWHPVFDGATTGYCTLQDGRLVRIDLQQSFRRQKFQEEKLKDADPKTFEAYCTAFDASRLKKEKPEIYEKFLSEKEINPDIPNRFKVSMQRKVPTQEGGHVYVWE